MLGPWKARFTSAKDKIKVKDIPAGKLSWNSRGNNSSQGHAFGPGFFYGKTGDLWDQDCQSEALHKAQFPEVDRSTVSVTWRVKDSG